MIDQRTGRWMQTWVDNSGSYLPFTGGILPNGTPFFGRSFYRNGQKTWQRMIFLNITKQSFTWKWQSSDDSTNWTTNWEIQYQRAN
jgi:hypothetical protein